LQQQMQVMQEAGAQLQTEVMELRAKHEIDEGELLVKGYEAKTRRLQALAPAIDPQMVQAVVMQTLQTLMQQPEPTPPEGMGGPLEMEQMPPGMPIEQQPMSPPDAGFSSPEGAMQ
jgi:hypothetical protein